GLLADSLPGRRPAPEPGLTIDRMLSEGSAIEALYVAGETIDDSLPNVPLLIVQDILMSETAKRADILFPACSYVERQGTFTNFEGRVQWFNRAIPPIGQARPDWQITAELARRVAEKLGKDPMPFSYATAPAVTREFEAETHRQPLTAAPPVAIPSGNPVGAHPSPCFEDPSVSPAREPGAGERAVAQPRPSPLDAAGPDASETSGPALRYQPANPPPSMPASGPDYPLTLISGPQRWVSGSTSRYADGLLGLYPEALVALSPQDGADLGLATRDEVKVSSPNGFVLMRAELNRDVPPGLAIIPGYVQPTFVATGGDAIHQLFGSAAGIIPIKVEKRERRELGFAGFRDEPAFA
ncbi:MAG: molybdopterin oxidoreductase family protein, partial [Chloroflexota bacterium]